MHRGSWRYQRRERNEGALRARLHQLAAARPRFGYRRLYIFLRREKREDGTLQWRVNHKRVYRLYREEGLAVQRRPRREVIEAWRVDYNTVRPHSSLRYLTPEEFAANAAAPPASPPTPVVSIAPTWEGSDVQEPRSANL